MSDPSGPPPPDPSDEQPSNEPPSEPPNQPPYGQEPYPQQPYPQQPYPEQPPQQYGQQYDQQYPPQYAQQPYGQQYGGVPYAQQRGPNGLTPDESTWGGAAHWSALIAAFVALAFLGPLLVLLIKGNQSPYIRAQSVESLNFQLTVAIAGIISFVLIFVLIGIILLPLVGVWWLVFTIIGSVKASAGELYRYPLNIRMVR